MSLRASTLKKNESQVKVIKREVSHILNRMDDELKTAHETGQHQVSIPIPINFSIPYMKNCDAQRIIYYKILTSLLDREFHPTIELKKTSTIFHITWLSNEEMEEIDLQNAILAKHTKSKPLIE